MDRVVLDRTKYLVQNAIWDTPAVLDLTRFGALLRRKTSKQLLWKQQPVASAGFTDAESISHFTKPDINCTLFTLRP